MEYNGKLMPQGFCLLPGRMFLADQNKLFWCKRDYLHEPKRVSLYYQNNLFCIYVSYVTLIKRYIQSN